MVGFGNIRVAIMNYINSHVYRARSVIKVDWVRFKYYCDIFYKLGVEVERVNWFLVHRILPCILGKLA